MTTVCLLITLLTSLIVSHQSRVTGIIDKVRKKKNSLWFRRNYFQNVGILSIDSDDRLKFSFIVKANRSHLFFQSLWLPLSPETLHHNLKVRWRNRKKTKMSVVVTIPLFSTERFFFEKRKTKMPFLFWRRVQTTRLGIQEYMNSLLLMGYIFQLT